ncbi:T6SS immunity protein Tdi1 domain-containing protein [Ruminiclostridium papyrosolvens]|uniref:T6SS immunity protein Tdi1 C-terminal domain-containing protein n=1 Tax=Ruminiclostridium papyrosolvens C7 TaxID=1330534 RepID=U4R076_9FIRM|nr:T6SS immunity protein Tdi1 domain-containing protein [Ruminiclostridium papyrosolvens]EPR10526.1 hypothetical protein L323_13120 [Ruminiclostridium papyrosolvens C7]
MYKNFCKYFGVNHKAINSTVKNISSSMHGLEELQKAFGGQSFSKGLYRIHTPDGAEKWNSIVTEAFPEFRRRIICFGYDWLGRQFALDNQRVENGQQRVLMFEPGTGEVLEIPCNIVQFHEEEIPEYTDSCLASEAFKEWISKNPNEIKISEYVGYKTMLFLGGEDIIQNLEKGDMDVYWSICSQLIHKTKGLPEGRVIKNLGIYE